MLAAYILAGSVCNRNTNLGLAHRGPPPLPRKSYRIAEEKEHDNNCTARFLNSLRSLGMTTSETHRKAPRLVRLRRTSLGVTNHRNHSTSTNPK